MVVEKGVGLEKDREKDREKVGGPALQGSTSWEKELGFLPSVRGGGEGQWKHSDASHLIYS